MNPFPFQMLLKKASEEQQELLKSGYEMLINPQEMGDRFKFLAIYPKVLEDHLNKFPPTAFPVDSR